MKKILVLLMGSMIFGACTDNHGAKTNAGKTFVKFANAKTIKEKAKYVLNAEEIVPYMEDYYKGRPNTRLSNYEIIQESDKGSYSRIKIKIEDRLYWVWIKKDADGKYKVDWQSYTRYTPHTIGEFIANEEREKKFNVYAHTDRSVGKLLANLITEYYTFRIISADIGQGVVSEKEDGYEVNESIIGLCPKKQEDCKNFYNTLSKRKVNGGCLATLQLERAGKDFDNPIFTFALVTKVTPTWMCDL